MISNTVRRIYLSEFSLGLSQTVQNSLLRHGHVLPLFFLETNEIIRSNDHRAVEVEGLTIRLLPGTVYNCTAGSRCRMTAVGLRNFVPQ
jgi:hypothetical protein